MILSNKLNSNRRRSPFFFMTPPMCCRDVGSIPGSGRSPEEGNDNPLHILAWKIAWTEEPGELQSMGSQRVGHD